MSLMLLELKLIDFGTLWFNFEKLNSRIQIIPAYATYVWEKSCAQAEFRERNILNK